MPELGLDDLLKKLKGLRYEVRAKRRAQGAVPIDTILNRMLDHIEAIKAINIGPSLPERDRALHKAWNLYVDAQEYKGPVIPTYDPNREVPLEDNIVEVESAYAHAGGLGYASVSWGLMGIHKGGTQIWLHDYWVPRKLRLKYEHWANGKGDKSWRA
jgi:hypothetical protein